jgi:hypothetical protein
MNEELYDHEADDINLDLGDDGIEKTVPDK